MPKLKTNKAARKRYKISSRGKVLRSRPNRRHLLTDKTSSRKRKYRKWKQVGPTDRKEIRRLLPYG